MFCPKCGAENEDGKLFCGKCGEHLPKDAPKVSAAKAADGLDEFDDTMIMKPVDTPRGAKRRKSPAEAQGKSAAYKRNARTAAPEGSQRASEPQKSSGMRIAVIVLSCCLAVMIIVAAVFAFKLSAGEKDNVGEDKITQQTEEKKDKTSDKETDSEDDNDAEPEEEEPEEEVKKPVSYSTIPVDMVYATTERTEGETVYSASNAVDSKLSTAWSPDLDTGSGEGITLCFSQERAVHGIKIANGYSKSEADYARCARAKNITVKFPDGSTFSAVLKDNIVSLQSVAFANEVTCQSLTIFIDSIYPGEDGQPLYVSEIEVF